jgi:hypothetical protein
VEDGARERVEDTRRLVVGPKSRVERNSTRRIEEEKGLFLPNHAFSSSRLLVEFLQT